MSNVQDKPPAYSPPLGSNPHAAPGQYPAGYAPVPGSYQDGSPPMFQPAAGQVPTYMQPGQQAVVITQQPSVVIVGGCPACRVGVLEDDFTCLGVCCAILFFPIGILCCLALRQRSCPNCGAVFS